MTDRATVEECIDVLERMPQGLPRDMYLQRLQRLAETATVEVSAAEPVGEPVASEEPAVVAAPPEPVRVRRQYTRRAR
jgi:hypothetical protein